MPSPILVYYDSWCPLCTRVRQRLGQLDWLKLLRFASIRDQEAVRELGVPMDHLERRMHVRNLRTGAVTDGIHAVSAIAARVPLLMPLWPGVALSARLGLGQQAYDFLASRRSIVPVGHCDETGCSIHGRK